MHYHDLGRTRYWCPRLALRDDLLVRTPAGINRGNGAGKANTMATLTEFPDRQLFGEDVIWSGDEDARFLSSHRIISTATHIGGAFGPASGRKLQFRTIADTFCRENRVWDEWLIRDSRAAGAKRAGCRPCRDTVWRYGHATDAGN